ncbi:MAG: hypothetical protein K2X00_19295 [Nitrospiraceae bacterium]|nr:hypothetical protein [Nitrospiraceae bacterium]
MTRQGSGQTCLGWMCCALLWTAGSSAAAPPEAAQAPDAEFLEFLGNWHMGDGRWVDPFHAVELSGAEAVTPPKDQRSGSPQEAPRTNRRENREGADQQGGRPIDPMREMKR